LEWMDASTKEKAIEKLEKTTVKVGYPDQWEDYSALTLNDADGTVSYFGAMLNIARFNFNKDLEDLKKPVDKSKWYMSPQTVNAYYNPPYNEIVFPAAILQPPFFDFKADAAVNYGGIGGVIGHEISHGFDDSGADYDADGNLKNWWTEGDLTEFDRLGDDLATQYSAIEVLPETFINGKFTLGENIGDLGGIHASYDALKLHFDTHGKPEPIDGFSAEERFFLSWGTIWRVKIRDEALKNQVKTDPHSPGIQRAMQPLKNMDAFYATFGVKETDAMYLNPEDRVYIW
jgi:putative endopeptidase